MALITEKHTPSDTTITADLCIIGGGVVGLSTALTFAKENPNKKVIVLESGFEKPGPAQQANTGKIIGNDVHTLESIRIRAFGGTQWVWGGHSCIFTPFDFEKRDWVANSGWPISYDEYSRFINHATKILDIDDFDWTNPHSKLNNHKLPYADFLNNRHFKLSPQVTAIHPSNKGHYGQSNLKSLETQENLTIYLNQTVTKLKFSDSKSRITEIISKTIEGAKNTIKASTFILATGGLENARLMKYWFSFESSPRLPCIDSIGRYFMEHPHRDIAHTYISKNQINGYSDYIGSRVGTAVHMIRFNVTDEAQQKFRINSQTIVMARQSADWDKKVSFGQSFKAIVVAEQEPNESNRVELMDEKDMYGIPKMNLFWSYSKQDSFSMNFLAKEFPKFTGLNDIGRSRAVTFKPERKFLGGHHHMGTTRMGGNATRAVVDKNCKVFGLDNLYVAGSSIFPTSGGINPTLNSLVLSQRLVDFLTKGDIT